MGPMGFGHDLLFKSQWPIARRILRALRRELTNEADIGRLTIERDPPFEFNATLPFDAYEAKANEPEDRVSL